MMKAKYCRLAGYRRRNSVERERYAGVRSVGFREGKELDGA